MLSWLLLFWCLAAGLLVLDIVSVVVVVAVVVVVVAAVAAAEAEANRLQDVGIGFQRIRLH